MSDRLLGSTSGGPALQRIAKRGRRSRVIRCYRALDRLAAAEGVARSAHDGQDQQRDQAGECAQGAEHDRGCVRAGGWSGGTGRFR